MSIKATRKDKRRASGTFLKRREQMSVGYRKRLVKGTSLAVRANRIRVRRDADDILRRISVWTKNRGEAVTWYRSQPISAFGDRTAEALVKEGKAEAVRDYLDAVAVGTFQ